MLPSQAKLVADYIKSNNGIVTSIRKLQDELGICEISSYNIETICLAYNIDCTIGKPKNTEHGSLRYRRGCKCDICRLACNLTSHAVTYFRKTSREFIDNFATLYVERYKINRSYRKRTFFQFFRKEFEKYLNRSAPALPDQDSK